MFYRGVLYIAILSVFLLLSSCSEDSSSPSTETLPEVLSNISKTSNIPGFSVSVIKNGKVDLQESYGYANIEKGIPYSADMLQSVASISKSVLGVAVCKAIELGYFTLDTDINAVLPFKVVNPHHPEKSITIRQLVTHTSGLKDDMGFFFSLYHLLPGGNLSSEISRFLVNDFGFSTDPVHDLGDVLEAFFAEDGSHFDRGNFSESAPGSSYSYSNLASSLTAYLIEVKSGLDYRVFVKNHILAPLGMHNTSFAFKADLNEQIYAQLYYSKDVAYPFYTSSSYPSGSIITTNNDLVLFLQEMIKGAQGKGSVLSAESYNQLFTRLYKGNAADSESHSVFWFLENDLVMHGGVDFGVIAKIEFNTKTNSGFVFTSNSEIQFSDQGAGNLQNINNILFALKDYTYQN